MHVPLRWRHNGDDSVPNHQPHDCLLNQLFRCRWKKTSKLRVTGLCAGNSPGTGEFPAQMASNAENVSIWWRHHGFHGSCQISGRHDDLTPNLAASKLAYDKPPYPLVSRMKRRVSLSTSLWNMQRQLARRNKKKEFSFSLWVKKTPQQNEEFEVLRM